MTVSSQAFILRFTQHILPKRFTKIRTYGYLANRNRQQRTNAVLRQLRLSPHKGLVKLPVAIKLMERFGIAIHQCPGCKKSSLELVKVYNPRKKGDCRRLYETHSVRGKLCELSVSSRGL